MLNSEDLLLGDKRFPIYNGDSKKLKKQVKKELDDNLVAESIVLEIVGQLYGESVFLSRLDIYGERELKGILNEEFDGCFHQSEQYFILFLDQTVFSLLQDHFSVTSHVGEGVQPPAPTDIIIFCYDRKDTCRYCRATLSYMLRTESLQEKIKKFIEEAIKKPGTFSQGNVNVNMYAFAKETTEL